MRKYLFVILFLNTITICRAQEATIVNRGFTIINNEKVITNDMLFYTPPSFPGNKPPLFMVNGIEVPSLCCFDNHDDFKKITVLQPAEGFAKFGKKGKHGVIMLELKDDVKEPTIEIVTNKIYYKCMINGKLTDASKQYFEKANGKDCSILDLRSSATLPFLYIGVNNEIKMKQLGASWDIITVSFSGGTISGTGGNRIIRVQKEGDVKLVLNINGKIKIFMIKAVPLPAAKSQ
ncbi:MAG: hypothetical protein ABI402_08670 [Ferruginibacter sp.]